MSTVGAFEAKTKLSELLDLVERGEARTITRRGTPVARLVPVAGELEAQRVRALVADIRETRKVLMLGGDLG
jgi:prevent-host-death family protein